MTARQAAACAAATIVIALSCACQAQEAPSATPEGTVLSLSATAEPSAVPTAAETATATAQACLQEGGRVEAHELVSSAMPAALRYKIYLPPCYGTAGQSRYATLYLFHGQTYDENQWIDLGVAQAADRLIAAGELPPFLVVMPFDPYPNQPYEYGFDEAFLQDLLPAMENEYGAASEREQRAIGGLSRGSSWALHFGLSRPELFGRFGMHSPVVFASDGLLVEKWLDIIPPERMPLIYLDISENDQNLQNAFWLENILTSRHIVHEWHLNTGFHTDEYWAAHVEAYLRWYAAAWQSSP